jgi:hypothetical protein
MTRPSWAALLAAGTILLTACGSATAGSSAPPPVAAPAGQPPALAVMVCGDEVRGDIAEVLTLSPPPATSSTWRNQVYTCTYQLPMGPLVMTVKESADDKAALSYFQAYRQLIGSTVDVAGLGEHAYRTPGGNVGLVKDNITLAVDATRLPARFGAQGQKRTDLAYEVASVILGCWTGDDD